MRTKTEPAEATRGQPQWVEESNRFEKAGERGKALDVIYDTLDDMLLASKFGECDNDLSRIDVAELGNSQLTSVLMVTAPARDLLPSRADFHSRVVAVVKSRGGEVGKMLSGLA